MKIQNLGKIKEIDYSLDNKVKVNIVCGPNNSGKTYLSYTIYAFHKHVEQYVFEFISQEDIVYLFDNGEYISENSLESKLNNLKQDFQNDVEKSFRKRLKYFFIDKTGLLENMSIKLDDYDLENIFSLDDILTNKIEKVKVFNKQINVKLREGNISLSLEKFNKEKKDKDDAEFIAYSINKRITSYFKNENQGIFFPAERIGLNAFRKELDSQNITSFELMKSLVLTMDNDNKSNIFSKTMDLVTGKSDKYPVPISDYLSFMRDYSKDQTISDDLTFKDVASNIRNNVLNGKYDIDEDGNIYYRERRGLIRYNSNSIPFHLTSSSLKSLLGLDFYLDNVAKKGSSIFFDEPELNLHPTNQIKLVEELITASNLGVRLFITTHSEYVIRKVSVEILKGNISREEVNFYYIGDIVEKCESINRLEELNFDYVANELDNDYYDLIESENE